MKNEMKNKIKVVENFNGYKVYKIVQKGEVAFYRCSNYITNVGWEIDEMIYDEDFGYVYEASHMWCPTLKDCRTALLVMAD